jgi:hypothetical protein
MSVPENAAKRARGFVRRRAQRDPRRPVSESCSMPDFFGI